MAVTFLLWSALYLARVIWEYQTVEAIPVRFLSHQTHEQSGLEVHRVERLDTPQPESMDFYVYPTRFSRVFPGETGTIYVDKDVPYIVYDTAPHSESIEPTVTFALYSLFFFGIRKVFGLVFSAKGRKKDWVYTRAKVTGTNQSALSVNKVPWLKLTLTSSDMNSPAGSDTQFESAPLPPEMAELYTQGMEVPLWVDPKNPKKYSVGIPPI